MYYGLNWSPFIEGNCQSMDLEGWGLGLRVPGGLTTFKLISPYWGAISGGGRGFENGGNQWAQGYRNYQILRGVPYY